MDPVRLRGLIRTRLQAGRCLVLIDGLDEVASAGERLGVVDAIAGFAIAQRPQGNQVICSSRIAGYSAAPLPPAFTAVRLLDMDDVAIERFLRGYIPAIERREAPDKTSALVTHDAERTVSELLNAFRRTPGIRRLAANPLLLTTLLLVHRTTGGLPERRVDAYKAVVDALGRTWRANQGIPASELPDERQLTRWLTALAEWMHAERPEGTATLRDLLNVLGPLWADINRRAWDDGVLQSADPASTDAGAGILEFVRQIEQHCGLLVERAPGRWGFPHLTFEEFYAGRALAFPGRVRERPAMMRARLHDPRYDEPILLALGLVGRDYEGEIDDLVTTALLAQSDEARDLGLTPTALEELLGRDFRFALRALADDIPAGPRLVDALLSQALDEALDETGRGRFRQYHGALLERIGALKPIAVGARIAALLGARLEDLPTPSRTVGHHLDERIITLASNCPPHPDIQRRLKLIATTDISFATIPAAEVLAAQGKLPGAIIDRLAELVATGDDRFAADRAGRVLAGQRELPCAIIDRLAELTATPAVSFATIRAAEVLAGQGGLAGTVVDRLAELLATDDDRLAADRAARALAGQGELADTVAYRLAELIATTESNFAAIRAARLLAEQRELQDTVVDRLADLIATTDSRDDVLGAAQVLAGQGELRGTAVDRIAELIATTDKRDEMLLAADVLARQGELPGTVACRIAQLFMTTDSREEMLEAAQVLAWHGQLPGKIVRRLAELIASTDDWYTVIRAAEVLGEHGELPRTVVDRLAELISTTDSRDEVLRAAQVLAGQGELAPAVVERIEELIRITNTTPEMVRAIRAADMLAGQRELAGAVVDRLSGIASEGGGAAYRALWRQ